MFNLLAAFVIAGCAAHAAEDDWQFDGVDRVIAFSDIHGAYDAMIKTFAKAGVIDEELTWAAGTNHLVVTGDLLDRGGDSRKVMDLIMRLEAEAEAAGGRVHQLIGNHEVMNLVGDLRYVAPGEYAAFVDDESADERERWFQKFRAEQPHGTDEATLRAQFDKLAPPGFFGHRRAFRADGHYGKWLLEKPLMIVVNGDAFVHGGVSSFVAENGLEGVNGKLFRDVKQYVENMNKLEDGGVLSPITNFYQHAHVLQAMLNLPEGESPLDNHQRAAARKLVGLADSTIHGPDSPLWYRGTVGCSILVENDLLQDALQRVGASRVVIGHTPTLNRRVLDRLNGQVIEIDTGMLNSAYRGSGNALIIDGDALHVVNENKDGIQVPMPHPRRVGERRAFLGAEALEQALLQGEVSVASEADDGRLRVTVTSQGNSIDAWFTEKPRTKGFWPELAAYRLDRLLGLDMVPVTVRRSVNGAEGTLQFVPKNVMNEEQRSAAGRGSGAWCDLQRQWAAMYVFDALTYNPGRQQTAIQYSPDNWQLLLVGNAESFSTKKGRPPWLRDVSLTIGTAWVDALTALDDDVLQQHFADVLNKRRLSALGKRRDELLADAAAVNR